MYTVVIADDEEEIRTAIIKKIDWNTIGFIVVGEAENGLEALDLVERLAPDLLLTDIKMPFISGIELARQAREIRPAMNIAFLSGYDDFKFAQQAIQYNIVSYLLKPISAAELTEELIKIRDKIDKKYSQMKSIEPPSDYVQKEQQSKKTAFVMSILLDNFDEKWNSMEEQQAERELEERAAEFHLEKSKNDTAGYRVFVTKLYDENKNNCTSAEHINFVDMILKKYIHYGSFYINGKIVSLVTESGRELRKYVPICVTEIIQSAERVLNRTCEVGVSSELNSLKQCSQGYYDAISACNYSKGEGNTAFYISDFENKKVYEQGYIKEITSELGHLLKTGDKEFLENFLIQVFNKMKRGENTKAHDNFLVIQMMATVYDAVSSVANEDTMKVMLHNSPFSDKMFISYSQETIQEDIRHFCIKARDTISKQRKLNSEIICDEAFQIINEEYGDETLTLVSISERLHISSTYLSALIKKVKGETFINLLTEKRMQTAKDKITCTSMKILDIAYQCGYSDQHYFSYCIKKYFGMSPNKMREAAKK